MDLKESLADADLKRSALENAGRNANSLQRKVYLGISVELGEDSELLGAMEHVRNSERRSGPTRKQNSAKEPPYLNGGEDDPSRNSNARRSKALRPGCRYAPRPFIFFGFKMGLEHLGQP